MAVVMPTVFVSPAIVLFLRIADQGASQTSDSRADQGTFPGIAGLVSNDGSGSGSKTGTDGGTFLGRRAGGEGE